MERLDRLESLSIRKLTVGRRRRGSEKLEDTFIHSCTQTAFKSSYSQPVVLLSCPPALPSIFILSPSPSPHPYPLLSTIRQRQSFSPLLILFSYPSLSTNPSYPSIHSIHPSFAFYSSYPYPLLSTNPSFLSFSLSAQVARETGGQRQRQRLTASDNG